MMTRYTCRLNGVDLSDIDPMIYVLDVAIQPPVRDLATTQLAGRDGQTLTKATTDSLSVEVKFEIHERDIIRRAQIIETVTEWALNGGYLTTNSKPERRLQVLCESLPSLDSALKWTGRLTARFTAYSVPFWEDEYPQTVTVTNNGSVQLIASGFAAPARVSATVRNTGSQAINAVQLTAGNTVISFSGLALPAGAELKVGYNENAVFYARIGENGVLSKRTAESSDELRIPARQKTTLAVSTDGTASTRFDVRGYYL